MSAHTPGLLVRDQRGSPHADVRAASGRNVAVTWLVGARQPKTPEAYKARCAEDRANADRLVAAWNACDGISNEALEGGVVADLLAALRDLEAMAERYRPPGYPVPDAQIKARAVIAAATGGAIDALTDDMEGEE